MSVLGFGELKIPQKVNPRRHIKNETELLPSQ